MADAVEPDKHVSHVVGHVPCWAGYLTTATA